MHKFKFIWLNYQYIVFSSITKENNFNDNVLVNIKKVVLLTNSSCVRYTIINESRDNCGSRNSNLTQNFVNVRINRYKFAQCEGLNCKTDKTKTTG